MGREKSLGTLLSGTAQLSPQQLLKKKLHFHYVSSFCLKSLKKTSEENLKVNFINRDGEILTASAKEGESLLEVVIRHHLNIDGFGACEGTLACSTCHLIFDQKAFDQLSSVTDEEMDMLDLAFGLTQTSRLGCQICMTKAIDGITVRVPKDLSDARRDQIEKQSKQ
ncbi:adrenodoxin-like [Anomaloglossus baeobatrachus]|uniref:adrenodoxin-like n=1 Tax=Anomaloglossus baeobatrachus TaxID=238106 RepID=UPI003F50C60A